MIWILFMIGPSGHSYFDSVHKTQQSCEFQAGMLEKNQSAFWAMHSCEQWLVHDWEGK
jgi:hypothetical protein